MRSLIAGLLVVLCGCAAPTSAPDSTTSSSVAPTSTPVESVGKVVTVVWVDDGDTVDVRLRNGRRVRVRMLGLNSPEHNPQRSECGGPAATEALRQLLPIGSRVRLVTDSSQFAWDRYGRLLRFVEYPRAGRWRDAGRWQLRHGHAEVYVWGRQPVQRYETYLQAQRRAQRQGLGLWRCPR